MMWWCRRHGGLTSRRLAVDRFGMFFSLFLAAFGVLFLYDDDDGDDGDCMAAREHAPISLILTGRIDPAARIDWL